MELSPDGELAGELAEAEAAADGEPAAECEDDAAPVVEPGNGRAPEPPEPPLAPTICFRVRRPPRPWLCRRRPAASGRPRRTAPGADSPNADRRPRFPAPAAAPLGRPDAGALLRILSGDGDQGRAWVCALGSAGGSHGS